MNTLPDVVRQFRDGRKAIQIARSALGDDATPAQIRSLANYIGRIERGDELVQNPSLELLARIAKGLDVKLTEFFAALEGVPTLNDPHPRKRQFGQEVSAVESDKSSQGAESDHGDPVSINAAAIISKSLLEAAEHVASALDRLSTAIGTAAARATETPKSTPTTPAQSPKGGAHSARRHRKTA